MTPEAQRIAIAEAHGWIFHDGNPHWVHGRPPPLGRHEPLDYLNDLNAMHEAEKVLVEDREWDTYCAFLGDLTGGRQIDLGALRINATTKIISATAAQRAEAFLRTLELWEE